MELYPVGTLLTPTFAPPLLQFFAFITTFLYILHAFSNYYQ